MIPSRARFVFKMVARSKVSLHELVTKSVRTALMSCTYRVSSALEITAPAVSHILCSHPILVIKNRGGELVCIAGLRSFQLAVSRVSPEQKIPVIVISGIQPDEVADISAGDAYLTALMFGLGDENWEQPFLQIWGAMDAELLRELTPALHTKNRLAQHLGINRRKFSPKKPRLKSELKMALSSNGGDL